MTTSPRPDTTAYEILVRGDLSEGLVADLGARCFAPRQGTTLMVLDVIDQAHLQGVLASLHDHNVVIERVNPI